MKIFFKILSLLFFLIFSNQLFANENQNEIINEYEQIYENAIVLKNNECYKEAATEFKRYIFFQNYTKLKNISQSYKELAVYYKNYEQYKIALNYIRNSINVLYEENNESEELENLYNLELEILLLDSEKENLWLINNQILNGYLNFSRYNDSTKQTAYKVLIQSDIKNWEWDFAKKHFDEFIQIYPELYKSEQIKEFNYIIEKQKKQKYKNPIVSQILSVIPGLGQLYSLNYSDALNAFLLNGSLIAATVYSIITANYADVILVESPLLLRFYRGNFYNAKKEALIQNHKINSIYEQQLISIVLASDNTISIEKNE